MSLRLSVLSLLSSFWSRIPNLEITHKSLRICFFGFSCFGKNGVIIRKKGFHFQFAVSECDAILIFVHQPQRMLLTMMQICLFLLTLHGSFQFSSSWNTLQGGWTSSRQLSRSRNPLMKSSSETKLFENRAVSKSPVDTTDQSARQLLGIKGASETKNIWAIRLQLTKPVTWIPLIWGVACGAAASGNYHTWNPFDADGPALSLVAEDALKAFTCMILSGPLLTGYTQTLNDWEDREIDAINEPYRPIPSGAISPAEVITQIWALLLSGIALAYGLDQWAGHTNPIITQLTLLGTFIAYIYSAPPLKLKANGWTGSFALGSSYITLPWLCGQAMFGDISWQVTILTIFYSIAGLGIAIVNDFKSIEGDRKLGLNSLPVAFGVDVAKWITVGTIDVTQLLVAAYLFFGLQETGYALGLLALIAPQIFFQYKYFLPDPIKNDVKYQASAQPFLVLGILTTALAVGHHGPL